MYSTSSEWWTCPCSEILLATRMKFPLLAYFTLSGLHYTFFGFCAATKALFLLIFARNQLSAVHAEKNLVKTKYYHYNFPYTPYTHRYTDVYAMYTILHFSPFFGQTWLDAVNDQSVLSNNSWTKAYEHDE